MSAFCVFALSLPVARERAAKRVDTVDPITRRPYSEEEWRQKVEEAAQVIYAKMTPVQVSPALDAPQFCEEWIELARKTGHYDAFAIKCRGVARDKKGAPKLSKTTGAELITWVAYKPTIWRAA
ncbi:hypothetical protein [Paraburkholderia silvatlantica]|uniref:Uncharacterized protein n=1 Tax=Paraburkholderia silvatlantica TaxID=321895 RepID=A0ABR6FLP5_9BURK|nr:hypothetical protein [Paraburkholderia silvatlantica]MBB2928356.1 hypothetical protein [Paraburkholderia silvatlantica]PVY34597.1 hypothetical protein C7411_107133 [Paraburkholderia silvatlantica]PXW38812.1 hypothetical protein C7413_107133 [Paraburkholderia silvatlantica]